jgi:hypothetical protein
MQSVAIQAPWPHLFNYLKNNSQSNISDDHPDQIRTGDFSNMQNSNRYKATSCEEEEEEEKKSTSVR